MVKSVRGSGVATPMPGHAVGATHLRPLRGMAYWRRRSLHCVLLAILVPLIGWRAYADRHYWYKVLAERTVFPACDCVACAAPAPREPGAAVPGNAALAAWQRPQGSTFDLSRATIPRGEIKSGGPPKDGIPALTDPKLVAAGEATYLRDDDRVIGVIVGDEARAYPLAILNYHEVANDRIGDTLLAVTYCPLCDSAAVFDRKKPGGEREFGVSGLLYNSNVLLYDRGGKPESLWSQVKAFGVSGPGGGEKLRTIPLELTSWKEWALAHPATKVLSDDTGYRRDYRRNPYSDYFRTAKLMFPAKPQSDRLPAKAQVLGVWTDRAARAYPVSAFGKSRTRIEDALAGQKVVVEFSPEARSLRVAQADQGVQWMYSLWFAWYAFRPETDLFKE